MLKNSAPQIHLLVSHRRQSLYDLAISLQASPLPIFT